MKPFEKYTSTNLWTEPHIVKEMLKLHLSFNDDMASRKYETIKKTVDFLRTNYLKDKESILDLGCGPGLYTNLFEKHGYQVTGIDVSENSLEYAKSQNSNVKYIKDNYIEMNHQGKYDLITMIYCDFSVLSLHQRNKVLTNVKRLLGRDAIFAFDVHNMRFYDEFEVGKSEHKEIDGFYMKGKCDIQINNQKYEDEKVCLTHIQAKGINHLEFYNWFQCYTKSSVQELLSNNGFELLEIFSNTFGEKNFDQSDSMFVIAKLKE